MRYYPHTNVLYLFILFHISKHAYLNMLFTTLARCAPLPSIQYRSRLAPLAFCSLHTNLRNLPFVLAILGVSLTSRSPYSTLTRHNYYSLRWPFQKFSSRPQLFQTVRSLRSHFQTFRSLRSPYEAFFFFFTHLLEIPSFGCATGPNFYTLNRLNEYYILFYFLKTYYSITFECKFSWTCGFRPFVWLGQGYKGCAFYQHSFNSFLKLIVQNF